MARTRMDRCPQLQRHLATTAPSPPIHLSKSPPHTHTLALTHKHTDPLLFSSELWCCALSLCLLCLGFCLVISFVPCFHLCAMGAAPLRSLLMQMPHCVPAAPLLPRQTNTHTHCHMRVQSLLPPLVPAAVSHPLSPYASRTCCASLTSWDRGHAMCVLPCLAPPAWKKKHASVACDPACGRGWPPLLLPPALHLVVL